MKDIKKISLRVAFGFEVLFFLFFYIFGSRGLFAIKSGQHEILVLQNKLEALEKDKNLLTDKLNDWNNLPFYKERVARNELQMAHKDDQIYI